MNDIFIFEHNNMIMQINDKKSIFFDKLLTAIDDNEFVKQVISNKRNKKSDLNKVDILPVKIKNGFRLSFIFHYETKDITKNYKTEEALAKIDNLLKTEFQNAELFTVNEIVRLYCSKNSNSVKIKISEPVLKPVINLNHDRKKQKRILLKNNLWLQELDVTTSEGVIKKNMHDKYRQINKYLEIIENTVIKKISSDRLKIVDAGSGKGYLTFALYDYLKNSLKKDTEITGIEFRRELVDKCNKISEKAGFNDLNFIQGTIIDSEFSDTDILIALHACDTATDEAVYKGIKSGAQFIVAAPCCQKQIRKEMNVTNSMASILKHGILKERQAVILTDGLRALILEALGYKTKVFEFISTEHTPKNIMIVAEKNAEKTDTKRILNNISEIKKIFGIESHYLEKLLSADKNRVT